MVAPRMRLLSFLWRLLIYTVRPSRGLTVPDSPERRRMLIDYETRANYD